MWPYVIKRILWVIPTLLIITFISFFLLSISPGDPVNHLLNNTNSSGGLKSASELKKIRKEYKKQLGLDLPLFYFKIEQLSKPDTFYKICESTEIKVYTNLLKQTGNFYAVSKYITELDRVKNKIINELHKKNTYNNQLNEHIEMYFQNNLCNYDINTIGIYIQSIQKKFIQLPLKNEFNFNELQNKFNELKTKKTIYKNYIPKIIWYGKLNQYHQWLFGNGNNKGIIRGDFGKSYIKNIPIKNILQEKIVWSLLFAFFSIVIAYFISIKLGTKLAANPESYFSKTLEKILFILYSMPAFFIGTLLILCFANPDVLQLFPPSGIKPIEGYDENSNFISKFITSVPYLILPIICYAYSIIVYATKLTSTSLTQELKKDYIRTARAKGVSEKNAIRKHALKNSIIPIITTFSIILPSVMGGSVIIETIFSIPGLGLETVNAIISKDYNLVIAITTLLSSFTIIIYLVADLINHIINSKTNANESL
jgi:peptide/nickel transport system permease protein